MTTDTPEDLIKRLNGSGRAPHPDLIEAIWERREETEPLLLDVFAEALDDDWPDDDDPRWLRLIHAGKFMLAWQNEAALPTFARFYSTKDEPLLDMLDWFEEDLVHYGPAAVPYLQQVAAMDTDGRWHYGRGLSTSMLTALAEYYPDSREDIVAFLRSLLPPVDAISELSEPDEMWADIAIELGQLGDEASRDHILALDEAGLLVPHLFTQQYYLRDLNRGFRPQTPPPPYNLRQAYKRRYEAHQAQKRRLAREKERQRQVRRVGVRTEPKIGRNDPCPCGSGKKYKKCCGRPGA